MLFKIIMNPRTYVRETKRLVSVPCNIFFQCFLLFFVVFCGVIIPDPGSGIVGINQKRRRIKREEHGLSIMLFTFHFSFVHSSVLLLLSDDAMISE